MQTPNSSEPLATTPNPSSLDGAKFLHLTQRLQQREPSSQFWEHEKCTAGKLEALIEEENRKAALAFMELIAEDTRLAKRNRAAEQKAHARTTPDASTPTKKTRAEEHIPSSAREMFGKIVNQYLCLQLDKPAQLARVEKIMYEAGVRPCYMTQRSKGAERWSEIDWKLTQAIFLIAVPLMAAYDKKVQTQAIKRHYGKAMFQWLGKGKDVNVVGNLGAEMTERGFFHNHSIQVSAHANLWQEQHLAKLMHNVMVFEHTQTDGKGFWGERFGCVVPKTV